MKKKKKKIKNNEISLSSAELAQRAHFEEAFQTMLGLYNVCLLLVK